ncbi:MAG TPA: hypothetical protein VKM56_04590 [Verrucomicrobiae bacterium]|nr:hypothetical protein [Verrucomicrobiae bacterium]
METQHKSQGLPPVTRPQKIAAVVLTISVLAIVVLGGWYLRTHEGGTGESSTKVTGGAMGGGLSPKKINGLTVSFRGQVRMPQSELQIEFKDAQGKLQDVGTVKLALDMNMPGMVMHDNAVITGSGGQYIASIKPQMGGDWYAKLSYNGPSGSGATTFKVTVH